MYLQSFLSYGVIVVCLLSSCVAILSMSGTVVMWQRVGNECHIHHYQCKFKLGVYIKNSCLICVEKESPIRVSSCVTNTQRTDPSSCPLILVSVEWLKPGSVGQFHQIERWRNVLKLPLHRWYLAKGGVSECYSANGLCN